MKKNILATDLEKLKIIENAINTINNEIRHCMCTAIELELLKKYGYSCSATTFIPELLNYKPKKRLSANNAWFSIDNEGKLKRLKILGEIKTIYQNK